jgi:MoaA/NifB/PqqE/SkfB family radical SAM enzyme
MVDRIEKFIWDLTYACPLRCMHCYSESGRRAGRMLQRTDAMRVVDVILSAKPERVSISGGEPLNVPWCTEAVRRMHEAGILVTLFTSGWAMTDLLANELASSVTNVAVSIDGVDAQIHDHIRGKSGSFERVMATVDLLQRVKGECRKGGQKYYSLGIDYTLTQSGAKPADLERFVEKVTSQFPDLDFIRFGAVIPVGLAAEQGFEAAQLLTVEELVNIVGAENRLAECARNGAKVSVTDVRYFLPQPGTSATDVKIAQIEPDGALRAFPIYEAKVGNLLEESLEVLWSRALAWRSDPFVAAQMNSIRTMADWARATRTLDRRYGSVEDKARIAQRDSAVLMAASALA